jgi:hypothetical protein
LSHRLQSTRRCALKPYQNTFFPSEFFFTPPARPEITLEYNGNTAQGKIISREKKKDGSLGDYGVAAINVAGAVVIVFIAALDDVTVVGIADDAVTGAVATRLIQGALLALKRAPAFS